MQTKAVSANSTSATRSMSTTLNIAMERKAKHRPMCVAKAIPHREACNGLRSRRESRSALGSSAIEMSAIQKQTGGHIAKYKH